MMKLELLYHRDRGQPRPSLIVLHQMSFRRTGVITLVASNNHPGCEATSRSLWPPRFSGRRASALFEHMRREADMLGNRCTKLPTCIHTVRKLNTSRQRNAAVVYLPVHQIPQCPLLNLRS